MRQSVNWSIRQYTVLIFVVFLQRLHRQAFVPQRGDGRYGRGGAGERGNRRHALEHGGAPDGAVVEERLATERRVDDERNAAVQELVADVRAALVDLEDDVRVQAVRAQVRGGAARGHQLEAQARELARDGHHTGLVQVVHADERGAVLRQALTGTHLRLGKGG